MAELPRGQEHPDDDLEELSDNSEDSQDDELSPAFHLNMLRWRQNFVTKKSRTESEESQNGEDMIKCERRYFWTFVEDSGFPNRVNHAVAAQRDAKGDWYAYSYGGYHADDDERTVGEADSTGGPFFHSAPIDVHCCDVETRAWSRLDPPPAEKYYNVKPHQRTNVPGCRYGHTVCSYKGRIYMYGGRNDEDGSFSAVECYDTANNIWVKIRCDGEKPSSRDGHACTCVNENLIIHGGFAANEIRFSGDTFCFNMESHIWRRLPNNGHKVPERDFHTATAVNKKLVVFGGRSDLFCPYFTANDVYDETFYSYNFDSEKWKKEFAVGYRPRGRRSHCAVSIGNDILYFAGYNAVRKQHFADMFTVNTDTWQITEIQPFGDSPCPRRRVGYALIGSDLMICGGTSPILIEREGKTKEVLHDHNDMYILHLLPTLQQLAIMVVIKEHLSLDTLPLHMQEKIKGLQSKKVVTVKSPSVSAGNLG